MVFSSTIFLFVFLPVTLIIYYNPIFRSRHFRNTFLFFASLFFYAWGEPIYVFLMLASIITGWGLGIKIQTASGKNRKRWLTAGISLFVFILFIFKYLTFVVNQLSYLLHLRIPFLEIPLPIGISFFLFQLMSYLFDIYYKKAECQRHILNVGLYISLFPQLIAGPIVRYSDIEKQIEQRTENLSGFSAGMIRFSSGLAKKVILANYLGVIADNIFPNTGSLSLITSWTGAIAYTLQIYFDFSGYSDMAIGLGQMFGFTFPENFNYPYISLSLTEFWRRWHISLSTWFRDYVYIPLGGNRKGNRRQILNLFAVWCLTGIWHGANWTFLAWGLLYFVLLVAEKTLKDKILKIPALVRRIYTLTVIIIAWVIFRSDSLSEAGRYIRGMFYNPEHGLMDDTALYFLSNAKWILIAGIILSTPVTGKLKSLIKSDRQYLITAFVNILLFIISLVLCISSTYNPFIYFNF